MKAVDRLYQYFEYKEIRPTNFEKELGLSNGYFSSQKKRNADIGETIFKKIIEYCRDLNPTWLLTGDGDMLLSPAVMELRKYVKSTDNDTETGMKSLVWLVWSIYERQDVSDFNINSFTKLASIFDVASINAQSLQTAMEIDVINEVRNYMNSDATKFDESDESIILPDSMANIFTKYEKVYKSLSEPAMVLMKIIHSPVVQREIFEYVKSQKSK